MGSVLQFQISDFTIIVSPPHRGRQLHRCNELAVLLPIDFDNTVSHFLVLFLPAIIIVGSFTLFFLSLFLHSLLLPLHSLSSHIKRLCDSNYALWANLTYFHFQTQAPHTLLSQTVICPCSHYPLSLPPSILPDVRIAGLRFPPIPFFHWRFNCTYCLFSIFPFYSNTWQSEIIRHLLSCTR